MGAGEQRWTRARVVVVLALAASAWMVAPHTAVATPGLHGAVITEDAPDPDVVFDGNRLVAFTTNTASRGNVPMWQSANLLDWKYVSDALPRLGAWAVPGGTWSPAVVHTGFMEWVLFYTATDRASGRSCIGRATATNVTGPYRDTNVAPVVCQLDHGGSIDPDVYVDPNSGAPWLVWKSDDATIDGWDQIWSAQLDASAAHFVSTPTPLITVDPEEDGNQIEAPQLVSSGGQLWLFYSAGEWPTADYRVHAVRCLGPAGPCPKDTPTAPWLDRTSNIDGPGSVSVVTDAANATFVVFHGWVGADGYAAGGRRGMFVEPVTFDGGGPSLRPDLSRRATVGLTPSL